jgi:hypothetical protein
VRWQDVWIGIPTFLISSLRACEATAARSSVPLSIFCTNNGGLPHCGKSYVVNMLIYRNIEKCNIFTYFFVKLSQNNIRRLHGDGILQKSSGEF